MGNRRRAREYCLQILFQIDFSLLKLKEVLDQFWIDNSSPGEIKEFTTKLAEGCVRNIKEIDALIEGHSTNWKLSRMATVDRNLLRLATYELIYLDEIPASVTINEAVEIAKKFGTEDSSSFINGILDNISKDKQRVNV